MSLVIFYFTSYRLAHHQELATMLLNYDIGRFVLGVLRVGGWVRSGWSSIVQLCFNLQPGYYSSRTAPNLQHTANLERNDQCGNTTAQPQTPDDGHSNARNMSSLYEVK